MLGDGLLVRSRCKAHRDAVFGRGLQVNRIITDAGAGDDFQSRRGGLGDDGAGVGLASGQRCHAPGELRKQFLLGHLQFGFDVVARWVFDGEARTPQNRSIDVVDFLERGGGDEHAARHLRIPGKGREGSAIRIQNRVPLSTNLATIRDVHPPILPMNEIPSNRGGAFRKCPNMGVVGKLDVRAR